MDSSNKEAYQQAQTNPYVPSTEPVQPDNSSLMTEYVHYLTAIFSGDHSYFDKGAQESLEHQEELFKDIDTEESTSDYSKRLMPNTDDKDVVSMINTITSSGLEEEDKQYLYKLGLRESGLNPKTPAQGSHRGLYQFNDSTLHTIGISPKEYDKSPAIQFNAALKLKQHNLNILKNYLDQYEDKRVHGIIVTKNGLAAAAHLAGAQNVINWFHGTKFKDGLGTPIEDYFRLFA